MSKKAQKSVSLEPTEEQNLRLQLMRYKCELNLEAQGHMDALRMLFETQANLYRLALYVAEANKPYVEQELARLQQEGKQVLQELVNLGPQIVAENLWPDETKWDPVGLTFSAPAQDFTAQAAAEGSKAKITIQ